MRVQRTRVLLPAVARRSPLTRRPLGRTKSLIGVMLLGLAGTALGSKRAPAPTMETVAGAWVGTTEIGYDFYRLELDAKGVGRLGSTTVFATGRATDLFEVPRWVLSKRHVSIEAKSLTHPGEESLSLSGEVLGKTLDLKVKAKYRDGGNTWRIWMVREEDSRDALDALCQAMRGSEKR
jgi:hypothetical protein